MSETTTRLTALILAGGQSRRMGQDKRLLLHKGKPFIRLACEVASAVASEVWVLISQPEDETLLAPLLETPVRFVLDPLPGEGPMGALAGALPYIPGEYALLLSVDYPCLKSDFLREMAYLLGQSLPDALIPLYQNTPQVTCAFYRRTLSQNLQAAFAQGERSLQRWLQTFPGGVQYVGSEIWSRWASKKVFLNVNTPGDYELDN